MHGNCRLVPMSYSSNDVLRPKSSISSKENPRMGRLKCRFVHFGHVPFIKIYSAVSYYPRKGIFLAYGDRSEERRVGKECRCRWLQNLRIKVRLVVTLLA